MSSSRAILKDLLLQVRTMQPLTTKVDTQQKELFGTLFHTVKQYHAKKLILLDNSSTVKDLSISTSKCGLKVTPISVSPLKPI